jgi:prepilin-type N-terminal cleavage/methylation domain-containing protein
MKLKGFTLIEITATLMIVGILAAIAIPNFTISIERARAKDARQNLLTIYAAEQDYKYRTGAYCTAACDNLTNINTVLSLNIPANGVMYDCNHVLGGFRCFAYHDTDNNGAADDPGFTWQLDNAGIVLAGGAQNPSCTNVTSSYCN